MKSNELSTELITHKLKIKWEWIKYITKKLAENVFAQLQDQSKNTINIVNSKTLTFITKYKSEVDLIPLDAENKTFEDTIYTSWLSEIDKDKVRNIWDLRKKERKSLSQVSLNEIIATFKK